MGFIGNASSGVPRQIRGTVLIGDVGGGTSGDVTVTGGLIKAQKSNLSSKSILNITFAGPYPDPPFIQPIIHYSLVGQGIPDDDNDLEEPILYGVTPGKFYLYLVKIGATTQDLLLYVTITEQGATII